MTANIRTPQRTVSAMQRFAVSQKNRTEAITISAFSLSLLYSAKNKEFSTLRCKNRRRPTEIECRLFCCPILLSRCRFCSFLKLLSYRYTPKPLPLIICVSPLPALQQAIVDAVHHVGPVHYGQVVGHHDDAAVFVMGQLQQQVDDVVAVLAV